MMIPRVFRSIRASLWVVISVGLGGCASGPEIEPEWEESEVLAPTEQILWNVSQLALEKESFPLQGAPDRSERKIVSGWKTSLSAFRAQGYRAKATITYRRQSGGVYDVQVRVERESNMDVVRPLDASYAKWEPTSDDARAARILLQTIRSYLRPELEISEEG